MHQDFTPSGLGRGTPLNVITGSALKGSVTPVFDRSLKPSAAATERAIHRQQDYLSPPPRNATLQPTYSSKHLLFNDPLTSTFTVVAQQREVHVHREVLMAQSPFLQQFLSNDPSCTRINANNANYTSMCAVLRVMYHAPVDMASAQPVARGPLPGGHKSNDWVLEALTFDAHEQVTSSSSQFAVVLSAWEISMHFHLHAISEAVLSNYLLPLVDRSNVVKCLKAALKHPTSSDAEIMLDWCREEALLPPVTDTPEKIAEWEMLCRKHPMLRAAETRSDAVMGGRQSSPEAQETKYIKPEARMSASTSPVERTGSTSTSAMLVKMDQLQNNVALLESELRDLKASRSTSVAIGKRDTQSSDGVQREPHISPQRKHIRELHQHAQDFLLRQKLEERQQEVDEELERLIRYESELLEDEEASYAAANDAWVLERQHLQTALEQIGRNDAEVLSQTARIDELEKQRLEIRSQCDELARTRVELETALQENDDYIVSTSSYLPAAAAAEKELTQRVNSLAQLMASTLVSTPGNIDAAGMSLRQQCTLFAQQLRQEKDGALKALEMEAKIELALRKHVEEERAKAQRLRDIMKEYHEAVGENV